MPALDRPAPSTRSVGRTAPPTAAVHRHNGRNSLPVLCHELLLPFFLFCKNTSGQNMNTLLVGNTLLPLAVVGAEADHGGRAAWEAGPLCTLSGA